MNREITTQLLPVRIDTLWAEKNLYLVPKHQRGEVWSWTDKRLFIDSLFRKYPFTPIMVYRDGGHYMINDGQQKLKAIWEYLEDGFRTFTLNEFHRYEPLPLEPIALGKRFSELTVEEQQQLRFHKIPIMECDITNLQQIEKTAIYRRLNTTAVKMTTGEDLISFVEGKAYQMAQEIRHHAFFTAPYHGDKKRAQDFHMAVCCLYMEVCSFPVSFRKENLAEMMAGKLDMYLTPELQKKVDETLRGMCNLFAKADMRAVTDIIPAYQAAVKLRDRGYELLSCQEGCLSFWFERAKYTLIPELTWGDRKTFAQFFYPRMQSSFWAHQERILLQQKGLIKLQPVVAR